MAINQMLADLYKRQEKKKLETVTEGLKNRRNELDVFFEEFLDLFDEKMSAIEDQQHPLWRAYKTRFKEWQQINKDIELADYYMRIV